MAVQKQNDEFYAGTTNPNTAKSRRTQIAEYFANQRVSAGLTQEDVARELGLESVELVEAWESGKTPIPLEDIFSLTNVLNLPPEAVLALIQDTFHSEPLG